MPKNLSCNRMPDEQKYKVTSGDYIGAIGIFVKNKNGKRTLKNVQMPPSVNAPRGFKAKEFTFPAGTFFEEYNEGGGKRRKRTYRKKTKRVRTRRA
jgi:hypothetical protein